jgi:uncharacterized glyoxalase superfamily protein PhnB
MDAHCLHRPLGYTIAGGKEDDGMATKKKTRPAGRARRKTTAKTRAASPRPRASSSGLDLTGVGPMLTVSDVEKSLAWYRDVLGFTVKDRWEDNGKLLGMEMYAGRTLFMFMQDDWKKGRDRVKGQGVRFFCTTSQDVDRIAERAKAKGAVLEHDPMDEYEMRAFSLADPDGYHITIARRLKK